MESFDPYSQWLGRAPGQPPKDHYELLGLARFEPDLDLISHTVDVLRVKIRKIRPGTHAADWQRLLDRLEAAKNCLSDPIAKAAYDESIDTASHTLNVSGRPNVTWDPPAEESAMTPEAETAIPVMPEFVETPPVVGVGEGESSGQAPRPAAEAPLPTIQPTAGRPKGNRLTVGVLSALVMMLSVSIGYVVWKRGKVVETAADRQQAPAPLVPIEELDPEEAPESTTAPGDPPGGATAPPDAPEPSPSLEPVDPPEPPRPSGAASSATAPVSDPPPSGPTVDPATQQAFQRSVTAARKALADRDLEGAASHLNEAVSLTQTDEERAEADQVEGLRVHLDAFWGSLREQIPKLESGSEIRVGEMMVVVVEAGRDYVILRVTGQNRRYSIDGMPHVLAAAMAEQLFTKSGNAKALRASFLIAEPDGSADQARQLLQEASQGGAEVDELLAELNRS